MAILGNILGNLLGKADTIIDECITSTEEKMQLKNELQKIIQEQEALIEQEVTKRWEADMSSDSWLSKSIRPLTLATLLVALITFTLVDFGYIELDIKDSWIDLWQMLSITTFGAYFGSRGLEKINKK